jgi:RNA polymerase sigma-70 factor (ECF subfamily)
MPRISSDAVTLRGVPARERRMPKPGDSPEQPIRAAEQLDELFRAHYAAVVSYVRRRAPSESADDVVAETFLVAWRRLEHVPPESLPWLLAVARNVIATQRRGDLRRRALHLRLQSTAVETVERLSVEALGPAAAALASLSEKDREALTLIAWDGLRPSQAAAVLGESPGAFRVRLYRAKRRLRHLLAERREQIELPVPRPLEAKETIP